MDFPQPESAATPITTGVWPGSRAMLRVEVDSTLVRNLGMNADGAKAVADATSMEERMNFMMEIGCIYKRG